MGRSGERGCVFSAQYPPPCCGCRCSAPLPACSFAASIARRTNTPAAPLAIRFGVCGRPAESHAKPRADAALPTLQGELHPAAPARKSSARALGRQLGSAHAVEHARGRARPRSARTRSVYAGRGRVERIASKAADGSLRLCLVVLVARRDGVAGRFLRPYLAFVAPTCRRSRGWLTIG